MAGNDDNKGYLTADDGILMVVRFSTSPLRYLIYPVFKSVLEVVDELKMPKYTNDIYDLRFLSVEEYLAERGLLPRSKLDSRYQNYTVQTFGTISSYCSVTLVLRLRILVVATQLLPRLRDRELPLDSDL